jgi:hypothetical protein
MMKANINILQHMKDSLEGNCSDLTFWPQGKSFDEAVREITFHSGQHQAGLQDENPRQSKGRLYQHFRIR